MPHRLRTAQEWFQEAARCYIEGHQACVWCGECHSVYKSAQGNRMEYYCSSCEFSAGHDRASDRYFSAPGHTPTSVQG
jgi:Zn finger protein HypA/HybF involved in hydrogenase expression